MTSASAAAGASSPRAIDMLRMQVSVEQRIFWRNRSGVFFTFVFPMLLLGFLGMFADPAVIVPGICALVIVSVSFQGLAIQLAMHRDQGVLKLVMATPLPPTMLVAGKICSIAIVALLEVALVLGAGLVFYDVGLPAEPVALAIAVVLGVAAFVALGFAVASAVPSAESAPATTNAIYLPMMFVSGVFYPVEHLPRPLEVAAHALPLTPLAQVVRAAWTGPFDWSTSVGWLVALAAWGVAGTAYTVRSFRWSPAGER